MGIFGARSFAGPGCVLFMRFSSSLVILVYLN